MFSASRCLGLDWSSLFISGHTASLCRFMENSFQAVVSWAGFSTTIKNEKNDFGGLCRSL